MPAVVENKKTCYTCGEVIETQIIWSLMLKNLNLKIETCIKK